MSVCMESLARTDQAGVTLRLARVKPAVREVLERDGVLERIGDDKTHGNVDQAVEAVIAAFSDRAPDKARLAGAIKVAYTEAP